MNKSILASALLAMAVSAPAFSEAAEPKVNNVVSFSDATINGSGCPVGTATIIITNSLPQGPIDYAQMTFDQFTLDQTNLQANNRAAKNCKMELEFKVPAGYTLGKINMQADGYTDLPNDNYKARLVTTMKSTDFNDLYPMQRAVNKIAAGASDDFSFQQTFDYIGNVFDHDCTKERTYKMTVTPKLVVQKKADAAAADFSAGMDLISFLIPLEQDLYSVECLDPYTYELEW